jgi:hypothetical protein
LAACPADSEIFTTPLRDYLDSTPQTVTAVKAVSKAAVRQDKINVNINQDTFVLSNEGGGLISQMVAAGYGNDNLYEALLAIRADADPSTSGIITDAFLTNLANAPASSEIFTTKLKDVNSHGVSVSISTDGTARYDDVEGRTYYGTFPTLVSNISGVGLTNFTHSTDSAAPLNAMIVDGPLAGMTTTYNAFAVAWASSTTAALAISTDCTVQVVNIYGSTYYGKTGTATLNPNISGVGSTDFTYTTDSLSPLIRWIVTGKTYDAFAIGWVPSKD